jgi:hypothetical protein
MENSFQTSFIPKKPITSNTLDKEPRSFFSWIAILLLVVSIASSVGLFLYKTYLTKQQKTLSSSLLNTRDSFEKETIDELELFDRRTESAKKILNNHIALSPVFVLLGQVTIPAIQYTNFELLTNEKGFVVAIEGLASDYKSIALQANVFNSEKGRSFKNVLFSNLVKDKNNNISFSLQFTVDPSLLSYEKNNSLSPVNESATNVLPSATDPLSKELDNNVQ